jgi:nicotinate-nucleotide adenylyltransferase
MAERIVIYGGTFDPVHHGHLITARAVAEHFGFERVTLMPANIPPHKSHTQAGPGQDSAAISSPAQRLEMLRLAVRGDDLFEVSELEIARPGPSYTYQTLLELLRLHGRQAQLYWIIGTDMLADLPNWYHWAEVMDLANIVTAARPPYSDPLEQVFGQLERHFSPSQVQRLRKLVVATPRIEISATDIRKRVAVGRSLEYLTPTAVIAYIRSHGLYGPAGV